MLYWDVNYQMFAIFIFVLWFLFESLISSSDNSNLVKILVFLKLITIKSKEGLSKPHFNSYAVNFKPHEEHLIDMFVIIIPSLVVLNLMVPTLGYLYNEELLYYNQEISFEVNIIGNQWFWTYEYIIDITIDDESFTKWLNGYERVLPVNLRFSFDSVLLTEFPVHRLLDVDNALVVPVNTNVLLSFTSKDVIHSWALPQMGIKIDCVPGRITNTVLNSYGIGAFYGQCSELCGALHGFMPICVDVITSDMFIGWSLLQNKCYCFDLGIPFNFSYHNVVEYILSL